MTDDGTRTAPGTPESEAERKLRPKRKRSRFVRDDPDYTMARVKGQIPAGYMTSGMICRHLKITRAELTYFEERGIIQVAQVSTRGWRLYPADTVDVILNRKRKREDGTGNEIGRGPSFAYTEGQAAAVFALLKADRPLDEIVIQTGFHPSVVRSIARDFTSFTGRVFVSKETLEKVNDVLVGEPLEDEADILAAFLRLAGKQCVACRERPQCTLCTQCVRAKLIAQAQEAAKNAAPQASDGATPTPGEKPPERATGRRVVEQRR